ncbi:MAG TPA: hypothetical protein DD400_03265 [Rhodospirillaceae bacterium]|nr:hypothetical protein [Rhodospirillaceae bacterium]
MSKQMKEKQFSTEEKAQKFSQDLAGVMRSLTEIMEEENRLLGKKDLKGLEKLTQKKMQLVGACQKYRTMLIDNPDVLKKMDGLMRVQLGAMRKDCLLIAKKNESAVGGALQATQNMVETIVNAAVKETKKTDGYKDPRKKHLELGTYSPVCTPVAFSRAV